MFHHNSTCYFIFYLLLVVSLSLGDIGAVVWPYYNNAWHVVNVMIQHGRAGSGSLCPPGLDISPAGPLRISQLFSFLFRGKNTEVFRGGNTETIIQFNDMQAEWKIIHLDR